MCASNIPSVTSRDSARVTCTYRFSPAPGAGTLADADEVRMVAHTVPRISLVAGKTLLTIPAVPSR